MTLTHEQISLVQNTFAMVAPNAPEVAKLFYGRLFEIAPHVRPLFKNNMDEQGMKLMQVLSIAVHSLNNLAAIVPAVEALGERHVKYGVKPEDYEVVGTALLWTLEKGLGEHFTADARAAWAATYGLLANTAIGDHYAAA